MLLNGRHYSLDSRIDLESSTSANPADHGRQKPRLHRCFHLNFSGQPTYFPNSAYCTLFDNGTIRLLLTAFACFLHFPGRSIPFPILSNMCLCMLHYISAWLLGTDSNNHICIRSNSNFSNIQKSRFAYIHELNFSIWPGLIRTSNMSDISNIFEIYVKTKMRTNIA